MVAVGSVPVRWVWLGGSGVVRVGGRLNPYKLDPGSHQAVRTWVAHLRQGPIEESLRVLVYLRASQLNSCTFCLEMHTREARQIGVAQEKLDLLAAWRDARCFSDRERWALALTESVTRLGDAGVSDAVWNGVRGHFTEEETASLLWLIAEINVFNRVNVATRFPPRPRDAVRDEPDTLGRVLTP